MGKRALGWISWRSRRRKEHLRGVLEALLEDLHARRPDHVAVTGDLTHLGLPAEIEAAVGWLERIGPPGRVAIVPGNHDAYAGAAGAERWAPWRAYLGDGEEPADPGPEGDDPATAGFPWVRRIGPSAALVGVSSARPSAPLLATGVVGPAQRARLARRLAELGAEGRTRIVLMHHPPLPAGQSRRRQLDDAEALRALLARAGAELILHGHTHERHLAELPGPHGAIPVIGVPSSSSIGGHRPERRARYHLYRIEPRRGPDGVPGCRLSWQVRGYDAGSGRFGAEDGPKVWIPSARA